MDVHWRALRRQRENVVALATAALLLVVAGLTAFDVAHDRRRALAEGVAVAQADLDTLQTLWDSTVRDAANAALSAALLLEDPRHDLDDAAEARLHEELKRELWDEAGAARLLLVARDGGVKASSAESAVAARGLRVPLGQGTILRSVGGRALHIGFPERSVVDGQMVLPLWFEVHGHHEGTVRAELRLSTFSQALAATSRLFNGSVLVLDAATGRPFLRLPQLATPQASAPDGDVVAYLRANPAPRGDADFRSKLDGAQRVFAWKRLPPSPVVVARGLDEYVLLAPVWSRARTRAGIAAALCVALAVLARILVLYLRRLEDSERRAARIEKRYWAAVESSSIGVIVMGIDGQWLDVNAAICRMLGYTRAEALALPSELHTPPESRAARRQLFAGYAAGRLRTSAVERPFLHKDGRLIWFGVQAAVLEEDEDAPPLVISHLMDITARREAHLALEASARELEERVASRTEELRQMNDALEAFSYSAAHDLRSPVGRISAYADALAQEVSQGTERARRWVEAILRQSKSMHALIDSLLALGRIARSELHLSRVDTSRVVDGLRQEFEADPTGWGARAHWRVQPLPSAWADPDLLRIVLHNLLGNALKYSSRAGQPEIVIEGFEPDRPGWMGVRIRDNGTGFDMQMAKGLFEPFRRLHGVAEFEGSGVGLAIVKRAVSRMGGEVWAEAEEGRGASFSFTLRAHPAERAGAPALSGSRDEAAFG